MKKLPRYTESNKVFNMDSSAERKKTEAHLLIQGDYFATHSVCSATDMPNKGCLLWS